MDCCLIVVRFVIVYSLVLFKLCCYISSTFIFRCFSQSTNVYYFVLLALDIHRVLYVGFLSRCLSVWFTSYCLYQLQFICLEVRSELGWKASGVSSKKSRVCLGGCWGEGLGMYCSWGFSRA